MKQKNTRTYILMAVFAAVIIGLDQWTKWLTRANLSFGEDRASILGIFHITYVRNTGGAWSLFEGQMWLFVLVMAAFLAALVVILWKKWLTKKFEWFCLAAIAGGGLGNMIDRLAYGYVTDMICFDFITFPVFNVADCFITVGCFALLVYMLIFDRESSKPIGKQKDAAEDEKPQA